jgi:hypothetical protein
MATLAEQASKLLDFNQKLDINLLDNIVGCMYSGIGEQVYIFMYHFKWEVMQLLDLWV